MSARAARLDPRPPPGRRQYPSSPNRRRLRRSPRPEVGLRLGPRQQSPCLRLRPRPLHRRRPERRRRRALTVAPLSGRCWREPSRRSRPRPCLDNRERRPRVHHRSSRNPPPGPPQPGRAQNGRSGRAELCTEAGAPTRLGPGRRPTARRRRLRAALDPWFRLGKARRGAGRARPGVPKWLRRLRPSTGPVDAPREEPASSIRVGRPAGTGPRGPSLRATNLNLAHLRVRVATPPPAQRSRTPRRSRRRCGPGSAVGRQALVMTRITTTRLGGGRTKGAATALNPSALLREAQRAAGHCGGTLRRPGRLVTQALRLSAVGAGLTSFSDRCTALGRRGSGSGLAFPLSLILPSSLPLLASPREQRSALGRPRIWNLGTPEFRNDFTIFFIYMNSYMNS